MVIMVWYGMIWYYNFVCFEFELDHQLWTLFNKCLDAIFFGNWQLSRLFPQEMNDYVRRWRKMHVRLPGNLGKCAIWQAQIILKICTTLLETDIAPENEWLEDGSLSFWNGQFSAASLAVSGHQLADSEEGTAFFDISNHRKKQRENPRTGRPWTGWKGHGFFKFQRLTSQSCITEAGNLYVFSRTSWNFEVCDLDAKQIPHLTPRNFCEQKLQAWLRTTQEKNKFETASATLRRRSEHEIDGVEGGFKNLQKKCCIELASFSCVFFCLEVLWGAQKSGCHPGHKRAEVFFISR